MYICFEDTAGNISAGVQSDSITLDTTAPSNPTFTIDDADGYTNSTTIYLDGVNANDGPVAFFVEGQVQPGSNTFQWITPGAFPVDDVKLSLQSVEGTREVRVKFKDAIGNISYPATDTIVYDNTAP